MRTFSEVYEELQHYPLFKAEPGTTTEAIHSMNAFMEEMIDGGDLGVLTNTSRTFIVMSYRHTAEQFIINWKTDTRTFKQVLEAAYNNLTKKVAV